MIEIIIVLTVLFILGYLYMIMPKMFHRANFKEFEGWHYAHRGLHNNNSDAPENSLAAFQLAVSSHYGIELDVQLTKDNIPVVIHDNSILRVCGVNKKVKELSLRELRKYKLYHSNETIPTLEEALKIINGKVPLILEYKSETANDLIYKLVSKMLNEYKGIYCVESFNPICLMWYKKNYPKVIRGQLSSHLLKDSEPGNRILFFFLQNLLLNFIAKPDFIAYNFKHRKMPSFLLCRNLFKTKCFAWTIRSKKQYDSCKEDFDYFIFDSFQM